MNNQNNFKVTPISSNSLQKERELFLKCWSQSSKNHTCDQQNKDYLSKLFDKEELDYKKNKPDTLFLHVSKNSKVVGYISFDIKDSNSVFVRQLAISPNLTNTDLIQRLLFSAFNYIPITQKIFLAVCKNNESAKKLVSSLGFTLTTNAKGDYNPEKYEGYELIRNV